MAVSGILLALFSLIISPASLNGQQRQTSCPEGMEFNRCGTACPRTCDNLGEPLVCTRQCVRGCFCAQGTILNGDLCIQPSYCASSEKPPMLTPIQATASSSFKDMPTSSTATTTQHKTTTTVTTDSNASPQNNIGIIVGSSVAAAAATAAVLLLLSVLAIVILVIKARSKTKLLENMPSKLQHGTSFNKSKETDVDFIPVGANEAYARTDFIRGNMAYSTTANDDYDQYTYI